MYSVLIFFFLGDTENITCFKIALQSVKCWLHVGLLGAYVVFCTNVLYMLLGELNLWSSVLTLECEYNYLLI